MNDFKGTKGKWNVKHSETKDAFNVIGTALGGKYKIARCPYEQLELIEAIALDKKAKEEAEFNAKLIASAPELLEALIKVNNFILVNKDKNYMVELLNRDIPNLQQLINKATS